MSLGAAADVDFGEILDFLVAGTKARWQCCSTSKESATRAATYEIAPRAAARVKPVIVLKVAIRN